MALDDPVRQLIDDLGKIPPELRRHTTKALIRAAEPMVAAMRTQAAWSRRIPAAIVVRVRYAGARPGVTIRVRAAAAPHARPYEGIPGYTTFRHRVFNRVDGAGRPVWVAQATRPFVVPSVEAKAGLALDAVAGAIEDSVKLHGWR